MKHHSRAAHPFTRCLTVFLLLWQSVLFPSLSSDVAGRSTARQMPEVVNGDYLIERTGYDELGRVDTHTDFRGFTSTMSYDVRGRMLSKVPDSRLNEKGLYMGYPDEFTTVASRGNGAGALVTTSISDTQRGWLRSVESPTGTLTYGYDVGGNRTSVTHTRGSESFTTNYAYDELSRLTKVSDGDDELARIGYDLKGNREQVLRANGVATGYQFDSLNRLKKLTHAKGNTVLSSFDYTVRQDGKRTGVTESVVNDQTAATPRTSSRDVGFTYDDAGRLTKEEGKDGLGVSYENAWQYDAAGNRSVTTYKRATVEAPNTVATTTTIAAVFTGNDWLKQQTSTVATAGTTNATTTFYGYDQNGAQTQEKTGAAGAVEVNEWQFDGTLASTVTQGQATGGSEFVYDAGGNRLKQRTQIGKPEAKEVRYLVDPNTSYAQVVQERDENNVLQARYAWEDGLAPLVMWRRAQNGAYAAFFYLCDGQDSVRQLTDASGRVTDSYFYDAFGNALQGGSGDTPNTFRYTGQQLDSSGDYYLRARYYNSGSGRFLSHDPLMGGSDDPITMHRYLYANADAINFVDPSGFAAAPPEFWIGQQVHRKIGSDFTAYNTIPTRLSDREFGPIFSRMGYPLPTGNLPYGGIPGFDLRPDLVDVATRKFFEIKMMNPDGIRKGTAEILEYQAIFTAHWMFTGCGELTTPGNAWDYMPPFLIPGIDMPGGAQYVAIVFPPVEGFIGYKLFNPRFPYYAAALALSLKYAQEIAVAGPGLAPALGQAYAVTVQSTTTAIQTAHTFIADAVAARTTQIRTMLALNGGFSPAIA